MSSVQNSTELNARPNATRLPTGAPTQSNVPQKVATRGKADTPATSSTDPSTLPVFPNPNGIAFGHTIDLGFTATTSPQRAATP